MALLSGIEPQNVFHYFEEICAIPHGSGNTKRISDYCVNFAIEHNLKYSQDEYNNVIIFKSATPGYENCDAIILQGHLDMVCDKLPDCDIDMTHEGLKLKVKEDIIYADGTTLGGDDGIAVAMVLAILSSENIPHPKLEAVFTVDEEIGMIGASKIDVSGLTAKSLINIDSEDEGIFTVSCAGGNVSKCILPCAREEYIGIGCKIEISGLTGGHSGVEINKGRANSNVLLGRVLYRINALSPIRIASVQGGVKDNAIPNKSEAYFYTKSFLDAQTVIEELSACLKNEYVTTDPDMKIELTEQTHDFVPMNQESTEKIITMLLCLPNGIEAMSADIDGLVQTSLNLGILETVKNEVHASFCVRSSVESQKAMLTDRLKSFMKQLGGEVEVSGDYPGWEYNRDSSLRKLMCEAFYEQYGYEPKVEAIHAGVECGMFSGKIPGLDCISIGPNLTGIHTPNEKMSISSVSRVWNFLLTILKRQNSL